MVVGCQRHGLAALLLGKIRYLVYRLTPGTAWTGTGNIAITGF
jgi:hypothetical protein